MGPTNEEEATRKKAISIEINNNKKKKKRSQLPPPNINCRNSYPLLRREKKDTTITSSCSSRVQETVIEDERIVQQISNLSLDTKLNHDHHQRRRVLFHDYIGDVAKTRETSTPKKLKIRLHKGGEERRECNYNDNHQLVQSKCVDTKNSLPMVKESGRCNEKVDDEDDDLTSCLSASGWKVKGRRSVDTSSLEFKIEKVKSSVDVGFEEFDSEMLEAAESLLMLRYGRPCSSSSMVMMEEEDSRININRKFTFDLNHPPPTTPPEDMSL